MSPDLESQAAAPPSCSSHLPLTIPRIHQRSPPTPDPDSTHRKVTQVHYAEPPPPSSCCQEDADFEQPRVQAHETTFRSSRIQAVYLLKLSGCPMLPKQPKSKSQTPQLDARRGLMYPPILVLQLPEYPRYVHRHFFSTSTKLTGHSERPSPSEL